MNSPITKIDTRLPVNDGRIPGATLASKTKLNDDEDIFIPIKSSRVGQIWPPARIENTLTFRFTINDSYSKNDEAESPTTTTVFDAAICGRDGGGGREIRVGDGDNQSVDLRSMRRSKEGRGGVGSLPDDGSHTSFPVDMLFPSFCCKKVFQRRTQIRI